MNPPNAEASSALSASSSSSSFIMLPDPPVSRRAASSDDSDDEIVYSVSEDSFLSCLDSSDGDLPSDDDFVVLSRPRSVNSVLYARLSTPNGGVDTRAPTPSLDNLTTSLVQLSVSISVPARRPKRTKKAPKHIVLDPPTSVKRKSKSKKTARLFSDKTTVSSTLPSVRTKRITTPPLVQTTEVNTAAVIKGSKKNKRSKTSGLGARSVVDDASDRFSDCGEADIGSPSIYEEAVGFITSFLSNPAARKDSACRLTLLQALIIELGLASSALPASLKSAKAFLKSHVFLNIKEYLAVREQGFAALQRIMHPSRTALIKDLRKNKNKAPRGWVKESGLQVLLVKSH